MDSQKSLTEMAADWMRETIASTRGLSASKWAKMAGLAATTVTRPVKGEYEHTTSLKTIVKLANVLNIPVPQFAGGSSGNSSGGPSSSVSETAPVQFRHIYQNRPALPASGRGYPAISHTLPVAGKVEAGAWREMYSNENYTEVVEVELPEYRNIPLRSLYVEGESINRFIEHGGKVIFVGIHDAIGGLQQDDYVIVTKPNSSGQHEITVKQLNVREDGMYELWPRSTDPRWQTPYVIPPRDEHAQEGIEIIGVVVDRRQPRIRRSGIPIEG